MPSATAKCPHSQSTQLFGAAHKTGIGKKVFMTTLYKNAGGELTCGSDGSEWQTAYFRVSGAGEKAPTGTSAPILSGSDLHVLLVVTFEKPALDFVPEMPELPGLTWRVVADGQPVPVHASGAAAAKPCESGASRGSVSHGKESLIPGGVFMADEVRELLLQLPADLLTSHNLGDLLNVERFPTGTWYGVTNIKNLDKATSKVLFHP